MILLLVAVGLAVGTTVGGLALGWALWESYGPKPTFGRYLADVIGLRCFALILAMWLAGYCIWPILGLAGVLD